MLLTDIRPSVLPNSHSHAISTQPSCVPASYFSFLGFPQPPYTFSIMCIKVKNHFKQLFPFPGWGKTGDCVHRMGTQMQQAVLVLESEVSAESANSLFSLSWPVEARTVPTLAWVILSHSLGDQGRGQQQEAHWKELHSALEPSWLKESEIQASYPCVPLGLPAHWQ